MSPEQLEALTREVTNTVRVVVNGKIDKMSQILTDHIEEETVNKMIIKDHINAMQPVIETIHTFRNLRTFVVWIVPIFAFLAGLLTYIEV
jgi:hypothetical protein